MKTLKFNIKTVILGYASLVLLFFLACEEPSGKRESHDGYSIIEIDSCEYIEVSSMLGAQQGYYSLTHKGNCKYCNKRIKK
jgi:hypothetical protein